MSQTVISHVSSCHQCGYEDPAFGYAQAGAGCGNCGQPYDPEVPIRPAVLRAARYPERPALQAPLTFPLSDQAQHYGRRRRRRVTSSRSRNPGMVKGGKRRIASARREASGRDIDDPLVR